MIILQDMMFFKLFSQSWRMIRSYKLYSAVNVLGLSFSLLCVIVLSKYIWRECNTDAFHPEIDRLYFTAARGERDRVEYLQFFEDRNHCIDIDINAVPEVERFTQLIGMNEDVTVGERKVKVDLIVTDSNYFRIFGFPLSVGDPAAVLASPDRVVVSEPFARKLFGDENPLGKSLRVFDKEYTVGGITEKVPYNTSFEADLLVPVHSREEWMYMSVGVFRLYPGSDVEALNDRIGIPLKLSPYDDYGTIFQFRPFKGYYLNGVRSYGEMIKQGKPFNLYLLGAIASIILLIGVFNFVNIYTITLLRRGKELGVKKVFGVKGSTMVAQFLAENLILVFGAVVSALFLFFLLRGYIGEKLDIDMVWNPEFDIPLISGIVFLLPFCTSFYPFLKYRYTPVVSLQHLRGSGRYAGRSAFLVAQYVMTIAVVIISLVFMRQLHFMLDADLGFEKDHIVKAVFLKRPSYTRIYRTDEEWQKHIDDLNYRNALLASELSRNPYVITWSCSDSPNLLHVSENQTMRSKESGNEIKFAMLECDDATFGMYGFRLKEGRMFNDSLDHFTSNTLIVNETARRMLGIEKMGAVLESSHPLWWSHGKADPKTYTVVGVIEDFRFAHLARSVDPVLLNYGGDRGYLEDREISVKIVPGKEAEALEMLEELYRRINDGGEFAYSFVSDEIEAAYREDRRVTRVYGLFAVIAVLISSMGLFSLSVYDVQQRYREIAIRKVNGATVAEVVRLLSLRYYRLLALAYAIAVPLAVWAASDYLAGFAVRAPLSWWIFGAAALITASVSLVTLWGQTWRAATENPAKAMKTE